MVVEPGYPSSDGQQQQSDHKAAQDKLSQALVFVCFGCDDKYINSIRCIDEMGKTGGNGKGRMDKWGRQQKRVALRLSTLYPSSTTLRPSVYCGELSLLCLMK